MFHLQVADQWPDIERQAAGRQLVTPAVAHHNFKWMDEFFRVCNGCRVDFIALHAYACDANSIMHYLHTAFQRWVVNDSTSSMVPFLGTSLVSSYPYHASFVILEKTKPYSCNTCGILLTFYYGIACLNPKNIYQVPQANMADGVRVSPYTTVARPSEPHANSPSNT